jgi:4'-phosphopantetheinyl transferase
VLAVAIEDDKARAGWRVEVSRRALEAGAQTLSAEERARCDTMTAIAAARVRRAAHALKREVVGAPIGMAPEAAPFLPGAGPPRLAAPHDGTHVSLSHTHGAIAVAVSDRPVGVDIEAIERADDPVRLAALYFAPAEARLLGTLAAPQFEFTWRWTAKEALLKACGLRLDDALGTHMGEAPRAFNALPFTLCVGDARI